MHDLSKPLEFAKKELQNIVLKGDTTIDATLGNGHDTLFLANLVGEHGRVLSVDIQEEAIISTKIRLEESTCNSTSVVLVQGNHAELKQIAISNGVKSARAIMFNLGYLPGGDKSIITQMETSLKALEAATQLLCEGGVITVMCYPGHTGGREEVEAVMQWGKSLPRDKYKVFKYEYWNAPNNPPLLLMVQKCAH